MLVLIILDIFGLSFHRRFQTIDLEVIYLWFDIELILQSECGVDMDFYTTRGYAEEEILPWDTIDVGITKKFLKLERKRAYAETVTHDCRHGCAGCGANCLLKEVECDA